MFPNLSQFSPPPRREQGFTAFGRSYAYKRSRGRFSDLEYAEAVPR